jgi:hypothetical protein
LTVQRPTNGLIARFQNLFRPRAAELKPATEMPPPPRPSALARLFMVEMDRRSIIVDCQVMYDSDTRASGVIKALARDAIKGGFELRVSGPRAEEAQNIANDLLKRCRVNKRLEQWTNRTLRDGDSFFELVANTQGDIVEVSRKPTLEMHRWSDDFDQFYDPAKAYFWTDQSWTGIDPPYGATYFAEWQIIHARGDHDENNRYGRPLFQSARKAYKRMTEGELDVAIRRKTRAGMKYLHTLEDGSDADIAAYQARNKAVLSDPFSAVADFFSSKKTSISAIQGDARLSEIEDIKHHISTWWVASPAPMSLLGYGQDLNRDVLDEQKEQYDSAKESLSSWLSEEILRPLIERQWLLKGIWPDSLDWAIEWAAKESLTAEGMLAAANAFNALVLNGKFSDETLLKLFSRFVPAFDADAELKLLQAKQAKEQANQVQIEKAKADAAAKAQAAMNNQPPTDTPVGQPKPVVSEAAAMLEAAAMILAGHEVAEDIWTPQVYTNGQSMKQLA